MYTFILTASTGTSTSQPPELIIERRLCMWLYYCSRAQTSAVYVLKYVCQRYRYH